MRLLLASCLLVLASAGNPRVQFFEGDAYNVQTRGEALRICQNMNRHLAHESQLLADIDDGFVGHHKCGWTYARDRLLHAHCTETNEDGKCKPGKSEIKACTRTSHAELPRPTGVYCRVFGEDDQERKGFKVKQGQFLEVFRVHGPDGHASIRSMGDAHEACEREGAKLAYWTNVATYYERYGISVCNYCWLREKNAVFNVNCQGNDQIGWEIQDPRKGYDAICFGSRPRPYKDPCLGDFAFHTLEGVRISCSEDGWIIIQDRPPCVQEEHSFNKDWHHYARGFGEMGKGYWLGLEILHKLTKQYPMELAIEVVGADGERKQARYSTFRVGDPENQYKLTVDGYDDQNSNAGDMFNQIQSNLKTSNGAKFSADPQDNDGTELTDCAKEFASGWWFQACHVDNLNGPCPDTDYYSKEMGAKRTWQQVSSTSAGLRSTRMKMRYKKQ